MKNKQIMAGYFRTWRDKAANPAINKSSFLDIPEELDIVLVFPWDTPPENPFWETLKTVYIPELHARGTKVVITQGIEIMLDDTVFPDTPKGHQACVDMLMDTYITPFNFDGLDIDYEQPLSPQQIQKTQAIFEILSQRLGPSSSTDKLLILDTNMNGNDSLITALSAKIDYLFLQAYGRPAKQMDSTFDSYRNHLPAEKFVPGFSFHEEQGIEWQDVNADRLSGRAYDYANWQPHDAGFKGGLFSYAIDRDIPERTDTIIAADFFVTRQLTRLMNPA